MLTLALAVGLALVGGGDEGAPEAEVAFAIEDADDDAFAGKSTEGGGFEEVGAAVGLLAPDAVEAEAATFVASSLFVAGALSVLVVDEALEGSTAVRSSIDVDVAIVGACVRICVSPQTPTPSSAAATIATP